MMPIENINNKRSVLSSFTIHKTIDLVGFSNNKPVIYKHKVRQDTLLP